MAEMQVRIDGAASTAVPTSISQGGNTAGVSSPGAALLTSTGSLTGAATLSAQSATGAGSVTDFGSAKQQVTLAITASAGVSAGAVALEVSHDSTNWFRGTPVTQSAPGVTQVNQGGAWRYARGNVTTTITGGTVSATIMGA
jgi:hypothetical protein